MRSSIRRRVLAKVATLKPLLPTPESPDRRWAKSLPFAFNYGGRGQVFGGPGDRRNDPQAFVLDTEGRRAMLRDLMGVRL